MKKPVANHYRLFISSVQKEFEAERRAIKDFVHNDPLLRRFFDVFLFEDLPASDRKADDVYLEEVECPGNDPIDPERIHAVMPQLCLKCLKEKARWIPKPDINWTNRTREQEDRA